MTDPDDIEKDPTSNNLRASGLPSSEHYFVLEAQSEDWEWMLQDLIVGKKVTEATDAFVNLYGVAFPVFYFSKTRFSADEIAKRIGYQKAPSDLLKAELIHLRPIGNQTAWEKPTVPYAGAA